MARQCSCPRAPGFLSYVLSKYAAFARNQADRYWIDDELRMHTHWPVDEGCFCSSCLETFDAVRANSSEDFVFEIQNDDQLLRDWTEFGRKGLLNVIHHAAQGIVSSHPNASIGRMTCGPESHRNDLDVLHVVGAGSVWLRPVGGFRNEDRPRETLEMVATVTASCAELRPDEKQTYEIENYPYDEGAKTARTTAIECLLQIRSR